MKCAKTQHLTRTVTPPKPLPTEWDYKPPPIFLPPSCKLAIAITLQQTLEFGLSFQLPQDSTATPFLTNFQKCLTLETNNPPLTHFQTTHRHTRTYTKYKTLLTTLKRDLKTNGLTIVSADKGPGLIILEQTTLTDIYNLYFTKTGHKVQTDQYKNILRKLKQTIIQIDESTKLLNTDDRPPTIYFKLKTHKPTFLTTTTIKNEIYTYTNGAQSFLPISRAIVNHKTSITACCSNFLRPHITPIIANCPYLTQDIFETISLLGRYGPPETIHTADIEAFYPSTPHSLVVEAFTFYNPHLHRERKLLIQLLQFNFATDGTTIFHLGDIGIPMGLPLAPELARMCTAYLLSYYTVPPWQTLTVYFDDIAATYPIDNLPLAPFILKETPPNTTQDCIYIPEEKSFKPIQQAFRQPVLLHPHSYHPSRKMCANTYVGSAFRATKIGTDPSDTLDYLIRKYVPALRRLEHNVQDVIIKLVNISYFPRKTEKPEWEFKPIIKYSYSQTRPTKQQLEPVTKQDFHFIPNLPLAPLRGQLSYQKPKQNTTHQWTPCTTPSCAKCAKYMPLMEAGTNTPIIPCTYLRCLYLLYHPRSTTNEPLHFFLAATSLEIGTVKYTTMSDPIGQILNNRDLHWQVLQLFGATHTKPYMAEEPQLNKWRTKILKAHPTAVSYPKPELRRFYYKHGPSTTTNNTPAPPTNTTNNLQPSGTPMHPNTQTFPTNTPANASRECNLLHPMFQPI